ncbi:MAG: 2-isopropylmalate synthase [Desulfovibrionaceae bacterium]|nr:2-isopropylmalate synthase [Desulfovibrionaceae bacterium]
MGDRVYIFDTTLRDGEQSPGATMNFQEKLRLAQQLESLGVDIIEAGFPASSAGDFASVEAIAKQAGATVQIAGLARCMERDIDRCWEAVKSAQNPRIHVFISTSPLHMEYKLRKSPEAVVEMAVAGVKRCVGYTPNVEFSCEDFSRSDKDFLCHIIGEVIAAGATTINLPDTVGYAQPAEFAALCDYVIKNTKGSEKVIYSVHCHNDLGQAVANSLAALNVGVRQIEVALSGIGERAGNAALEEIVMALQVRKDFYGLSHNITTEKLYPTCRLLSMIIGRPIPLNKAIIGANAFAHESGIHQDGMLKNRETYEIMTPQSVGRTQTHLIIGKHSGRNAVQQKFESLGYHLTSEQLNEIFTAVKDLADRKKTLHDEDLMALVQQEIYRIPDRIRLRHVSVHSSDTGGMPPVAAVLMDVNGIEKNGAGFGVGPIDALFNVISDLVERTPELEQYAINAVTGGMDALGEVTVRIRDKGLSAIGRGTHPDIFVASARAYVDALNNLVKREEEGERLHAQLETNPA